MVSRMLRAKTLSSSTFLLAAVALAACGGSKPATGPSGAPTASPDAGAPASSSASRPLPALGPLPPMATMPPPGVAGSKKAKTKTDAALGTCAGAIPRAKDPEGLVKKVGEACASASKGAKPKPLGAPFKGQQADSAPHAEHKLRVDAGKCYRVYFATDEGARDVVVVARDSAGDIIAESPGPALPSDGTMCFTSADEITLLVSVGAGKASYVVQAWSD